jgi:hypothetical protein
MKKYVWKYLLRPRGGRLEKQSDFAEPRMSIIISLPNQTRFAWYSVSKPYSLLVANVFMTFLWKKSRFTSMFKLCDPHHKLMFTSYSCMYTV